MFTVQFTIFTKGMFEICLGMYKERTKFRGIYIPPKINVPLCPPFSLIIFILGGRGAGKMNIIYFPEQMFTGFHIYFKASFLV